MTEAGGIHAPFVAAAKEWLAKLAQEKNFTIEYIENAEPIDEAFLSKYQLFIQLNYPPYMWSDKAKAAFQKYITEGKGGWIGFHHATLLGEFDGYQMWPWFSEFMGGIRYKNYIASFAKATVHVEATKHPCMKDVPASFEVEKEEWYTYNKSPRPNVRVLAAVDESTYSPDSELKMGDHPVVWSNEHMKARNIYIFMGHHPDLLTNKAFTTIFRNAIFWAAQK
jgi:type 1 glutamine amidotransferase